MWLSRWPWPVFCPAEVLITGAVPLDTRDLALMHVVFELAAADVTEGQLWPLVLPHQT